MIRKGLLMLMGVAMVAGCGRAPEPTVTVSIPPLEWFVKAIAGDSVRVATLVPQGASPESFELTPAQLRTLVESDAYVAMGHLPFEARLMETVRRDGRGMPVAVASDGIAPIYGTHDDCMAHDGDGDHHHHHAGAPDPHTWTSVRNGRVIAANVLAALVAAYPERRTEMERRAASLDARLDSLDRLYQARLDSAPTRSFMIWHPSLSYLARDYGLDQQAVNLSGKENSVKGHLKALRGSEERGAARVMFVQADFDPRMVESLPPDPDRTVVSINPMSPDWLGELVRTLEALCFRVR